MNKILFLFFVTTSLNGFSQDKIRDTIINCSFRENQSSICPICKRDKNTLPIFYGLTTGKFYKKNRKKYYFGDCEITGCDPKYYCKTDNYKF